LLFYKRKKQILFSNSHSRGQKQWKTGKSVEIKEKVILKRLWKKW